MKNNFIYNYHKIIIIGCAGSGKSYFARELNQKLNIPLYHLDLLYWKENWVETPREEFVLVIKEIMKNDKWIIDGNYSYSLEDRVKEADLIFYLDLPTQVCLDSEKERRGKKRPDLPEYLEEKYDEEFITFIKEFKKNKRPAVLELLKKYPEKKVVIFTSREEKEEFVKSI